MDFFSLLIGMAATFVALLLGLATLGGRIRGWFIAVATEALLDAKLIRYPAHGKKNWPNGADTLPDAIEHLWDNQAEIKKRLQELHPSERPESRFRST